MCSRCEVKRHGKEDRNNNVIKCRHCQESHEAGSNSCIEYKYQQQISIQAKEKVTRNQARAILERRNPHFKSTSYAAVAKSSTVNIAFKITNNRSNNNTDNHTTPQPPNLGEDEDVESSEVEVVCRSPTSRELFTKYEEESERATRKSREVEKMEEKRERRKRERAGSDKERKRNRSANRESTAIQVTEDDKVSRSREDSRDANGQVQCSGNTLHMPRNAVECAGYSQ